MRITSRFERKYQLSVAQYYQVRNALRSFMTLDPYTAAAGGRYLVRSLYFDTSDYAAFHERNQGNYGRIKLRIRSYSDTITASPQVLVELKTKKGSVMEKYGSFVPCSRYLQFMQTRSWLSPADPVLIEFERLLRVRSLLPTLLVQYLREGYQSRDRVPVRVTLDHNVSSTRSHMLFPDNPLLKPHRPKHIVLEIKCARDQEPEWLQHIVRRHSLKMVPNSKYVQGIEIVRPSMATPRLVV
ncbi:polyphosphate polymerase domain-containing protein [Spirochaeta africana]|uniref:VTC domain-containing protein n=1 Tax=Spirochaeta africana (strain ATCC 700263 / DSM 8902 / Z-7692) TaxID=889378 RepID=H9UHZ3_SPIAZ|nr:polyphosphate polymerase domain-containing protein [Spirochaeta africana]AFG37136.1 VTC domain-containing protein [Spirochaeta africana DSM 8902]